MKKKKNILYIIPGETGFIETDEKILKSFANVKKVSHLQKSSVEKLFSFKKKKKPYQQKH